MTNIMHIGLGEIGKGVVSAIIAQSRVLKLTAVVDTNPLLVGKNIREVMNRKDLPSITITGSIKEALGAQGHDRRWRRSPPAAALKP